MNLCPVGKYGSPVMDERLHYEYLPGSCDPCGILYESTLYPEEPNIELNCEVVKGKVVLREAFGQSIAKRSQDYRA